MAGATSQCLHFVCMVNCLIHFPTSVRGLQKLAYILNLLIHHFSGCVIASDSMVEKVTLWKGLLYLLLRSETDEGVGKTMF